MTEEPISMELDIVMVSPIRFISRLIEFRLFCNGIKNKTLNCPTSDNFRKTLDDVEGSLFSSEMTKLDDKGVVTIPEISENRRSNGES